MYNSNYSGSSRESKLHIRTVTALKELFPGARILEEHKIKNPETGRAMWLDIFMPAFNVAIEVQGEQHSAGNGFFHSGEVDFSRQKRRDDLKEIWCSENNIILVKVYHNEDITPDSLREKFFAALQRGD